jgi:CHAT domain-containing protein
MHCGNPAHARERRYLGRCAQYIAAPPFQRPQIRLDQGQRKEASFKFNRFFKLFRGATADIESIREIPPLPATVDELCEVGRRLGISDSDILLGNSAPETKLKDLSEQGRLADYAILHFATHGALARARKRDFPQQERFATITHEPNYALRAWKCDVQKNLAVAGSQLGPICERPSRP